MSTKHLQAGSLYVYQISYMMDVMLSNKMVRAITKYTLHALAIYSFTTHGNNDNNPDSQRQQNN